MANIGQLFFPTLNVLLPKKNRPKRDYVMYISLFELP